MKADKHGVETLKDKLAQRLNLKKSLGKFSSDAFVIRQVKSQVTKTTTTATITTITTTTTTTTKNKWARNFVVLTK